MPTPSLDPNASTIVHGWWSRRASFIGPLKITPEDSRSFKDERSGIHPPAAARSRASTMGRPKASPTMLIMVIRSASTVCQSSSASKFLPASVDSIPPWLRVARPEMPEVPCISGAAHSWRISLPAATIRPADAAASAGVVGTFSPNGRKVASMAPNRFAWSHMTALGIPVVPPV